MSAALTASKSLCNSTIDFFIGKEKHLFTLHWALLLKRAPCILSHTVSWVNWDMYGGSQVAYLETEDALTFDAFKNWLYNNYVRGLAYGEGVAEPGGPGALWSFAVRWSIDKLQNRCMDEMTYAFFVEPRRMKMTSPLVNELLELDRHGKMRKFLMMVFVNSFKVAQQHPNSARDPVLNSTFQSEVGAYWDYHCSSAFTPYVYNHLDFHI
ncbi:hypothetical protein MMC32_007547 [Xylographa parallela]|nr:hypothetical protein [Xylographa parallela]